jgi:hypothetical protein
MTIDLPERTQDIAARLLSGYQFSRSDRDEREFAELYTILEEHFDWFQTQLGLFGFTLNRDDGVIFLEKEGKTLNKEEQQTIVVLYLLADLWLEKGNAFGDLFARRVNWRQLEWFRDGYGKEYLAQVDISAEDGLQTIEELWGRLARKGLVAQDTVTGHITLRQPAERLLNMARTIHSHVQKTERHIEVESGS